MEITLLGDMKAWDTRAHLRAPLPLGTPQVRVAFAVLTLERHHGISRDALAEAIWPSGRPPTWAAALRTTVSKVRSIFARTLGCPGEDPVVTRGGSYVLRLPDDTVVDVELTAHNITDAQGALADRRFVVAQRLALDATERLRAPFLPGSDGGWVTVQRVRLTELLVTGLEVVSRADCALGDAAGAVTAALDAVALAPLRESSHRCLMSAHAATGNRGEALRTYQRLRLMLAEELGIDPDAATESAYLALLGPAADPAAGAPGSTGDAAALVGRRRELAVAAQAWQRARSGDRQVVVVTGEAGIGKTRLVAELARQASADGALTLFGRCDRDAAGGYEPFVEMLDAVVATTPDDALPRLSDAARAELAAVLPSFADQGARKPTRMRSLLGDAVTKLVEHLARDRPLLLVMDDLHWADRDSLLLLRHLLRRTADMRLLVVVISRGNPSPAHPLAGDVSAMARDGSLTRLRLGGLDPTACVELSRRFGSTARGAAELVAATAGNPFLLAQLDGLDLEVGGPMPAALDDFVTDRLAALPPEARSLLGAAVVSGSRFELDVAGLAAGLDRDRALSALEVARAEGLVVEVGSEAGNHYRFVHDMLRRTHDHQLGRERRRRLHSRLAETIEELHRDALDRRVVDLAHHRCAAAADGGDERAVRSALAAAARAASSGAVDEAVQWCHRAKAHVPPGNDGVESEVLTELGLLQARQVGGEVAAAVPTLLDAVVRARAAGRPDVASRSALGLADLARRSPAVRQDAAAAIGQLLGDGQLAAGSVVWARLVARHAELCSESAPAATGAATALTILRPRLDHLGGPEHLEERELLAAELQHAARAAHDTSAQVLGLHHQAMAAAIRADFATTDRLLASMAMEIDASGRCLLAERRLAEAVCHGSFADVPVLVRLVHEHAASGMVTLPNGVSMARSQALLARWLTGNGECDTAQVSAAERVLVCSGAGDRGSARLAAREVLWGSSPLPDGDLRLHELGLLALAVVELDEPALALDLFRRLEPHAMLVCGAGYRSFVGTVAFHLGRLAAVAGEWTDAERYLTTALGQLSSIRAQPWFALALHSLASVLEARGRSSDRDWVRALRDEVDRIATDVGLRRDHTDAGAAHAPPSEPRSSPGGRTLAS